MLSLQNFNGILMLDVLFCSPQVNNLMTSKRWLLFVIIEKRNIFRERSRETVNLQFTNVLLSSAGIYLIHSRRVKKKKDIYLPDGRNCVKLRYYFLNCMSLDTSFMRISCFYLKLAFKMSNNRSMF